MLKRMIGIARGLAMRVTGWVAWGVLCLGTMACAATTNAPALEWAFPLGLPASPGPPPDAITRHTLPGSTAQYTEAQIHDLFHAVDWRPVTHPPMPIAVAGAGKGVFACGYCHGPAGQGRPENQALAGLPADYIERQVVAFATGTRRSASANNPAAGLMTMTAKKADAQDVAAAAAYFSAIPFISHSRVVEAKIIPHVEARRFIYVNTPGPAEPLGDRIVEVPDALERFEMRDPDSRFTAYVPVGAIAQGAALVATGGPAAQPRGICHGEGLRGGIAPALAGRSPTALVRQLLAFRAGTRANEEAAPMRQIAAGLDDRQIIALAAYAATLKP